MSKSKVVAYYHLVTSTKKRNPLITESIEDQLFRYIRALAYRRGVRVIAINGTEDHIHILIRTDGTIAPILFFGFLKSQATKFINERTDCCEYFMWQTGGGVFTLHHSAVDRTIKYIKRQKEHHAENEKNLDEELLFLENF